MALPRCSRDKRNAYAIQRYSFSANKIMDVWWVGQCENNPFCDRKTLISNFEEKNFLLRVYPSPFESVYSTRFGHRVQRIKYILSPRLR